MSLSHPTLEHAEIQESRKQPVTSTLNLYTKITNAHVGEACDKYSPEPRIE